MFIKPWRTATARTSFPNTPESDLLALVAHDVTVEYQDGRPDEVVRLLAREPGDALDRVAAMDADALAALPRVAGARAHAGVVVPAVPVNMVASGGSPNTAFLCASTGGTLTEIHAALAAGADLGATDEEGDNALLRAAFWNPHEDVCRFLISAGLSLHTASLCGQWPIHGFAESGKDNLVRLALNRGQSADHATTGGSTPLMLAARHGRATTTTLLLELGARVDARSSLTGDTALHNAATAEIVDTLLAAGAEIERHNSKGMTPLMCIARDGHLDACAQMIERGAQVAATADDGAGALLFAAVAMRPQICALLLEHGADPQASNTAGQSFASLAAAKPELEVVYNAVRARGAMRGALAAGAAPGA